MQLDENSVKPFSFKDPHQAKIYKRLLLLSPGAASFYKDACRIKSSEFQLDSSAHLIAHLLREIESSIRAVMVPITYSPPTPCKICGNKPEAHKDQIEKIIETYGLNPKDKVAELWFKIADQGSSLNLARLAHREGLGQARKVDEAYDVFWQDMQLFLDRILDLLESNYSQYIKTIDQLLAQKSVSKKDVLVLAQHVPNNLTTLRYFFDKVTDPNWLPMLNKNGFFLNPPGTISHESGGVSYPFWPQGVYLKKMAKVQQCQDLVTKICLNIEADNIRVRADIIDISLELPLSSTIQLIEKFIVWIDTIQPWLQPERYGKLITHLANNGYGDEAITIAKALLQITPDPKKPVKVEAKGKEYEIPQDPKALFDDNEYEQIIKENIPSLVPHNGEKIINLLADLLTDAIALRKPSRVEPQDYSTIWQPAIEDHSENFRHGVKSILVSAIRNIAEQYIKLDRKNLQGVVEGLQKRQYVIFQRITLYLIRMFAKCSPQLVASTLLDKGIFDNYSLLHEYFLLAKEQFANLTKKDQEIMLGWIENGADVADYKKRCRQNKFKYTQENVDRYIKTWQRDRLAPIKDSLNETWKARYESLVKDVGEPDGHVFMSVVTRGSWGPTSPKNATELKSLSIDKLIKYLQEWQPSKELHGESEEGLGRALVELVKGNSLTFSKNADKFIGLRPTYVRNFLRALWEIANKPEPIGWGKVLELCSWVIQQPKTEDEDDSPSWNQDPGWSWSFNTIAELLQVGLREGKSEIPWAYKTTAWQILEKLAQDSNPTPKREAKYLEDSDPTSLSFNTTRGDAIHAVIEYALWCKRHLKKEFTGLDAIPEVKKVLEDHLDLSKEPSVIIRSIYGEKLTALAYLDKKWVAKNVTKIFPRGEKTDDLWFAAWSSYILFCRPFHEVYDFLEQEYIFALTHLGKIKTKKRYSTDVDQRFIEHLMTLYWSGKITLGDEVLKRFYNVAPEDLCYKALDYVGRIFDHSKEESIPPEFVPRLQALWEFRLAAVKASHVRSSKELNAFGWWFVSGIFPEEWAITQLIEALKLASKIYPDIEVAEKLIAYIPKTPEGVVEAVDLMIENDTDGWGVIHSKETIRQIIEAIKQTHNDSAIRKASELVNKLVAKGFIDEYKDLI